MPHTHRKTERKRRRKFKRAKVRHFLFTHGPHRLTRGKSTRRHLRGDIARREIEIHSSRWPQSFDGLRIAHISDFHYGHLMPADRAVQIIAETAEQRPDLIACTGDIIDLHCDGAEPIFDALAGACAPLGSFLVLGNHDELHDRLRVEEMAREAGIKLLEDERSEIVHNGSHLSIGGVTWGKSQRECAERVSRACDGTEHLLLSHNPKSFSRASKMGIALTLAGHTHGGQIAMKSQRDVNLSISHRRSAGLYERNECHLFVTTGVGAWFPLRVNCPAEIAMLTMRSVE